MQPVPIAVRLASGIALRGHEWIHEGPPIVLVHDYGGDLDEWGPLPGRLVHEGFRVIAIELRGHGLSDGDEEDPAATVDDLRKLLAELRTTFGPVALVSHGRASAAAFRLSAQDGAPVHAVISPAPGDEIDWKETVPAVRLIINGTLDAATKQHVDAIYPAIRGQKLWVTTASAATGPALVLEHRNLYEQLVMFIRRYLTPHHVVWAGERSTEDGLEPSVAPRTTEA